MAKLTKQLAKQAAEQADDWKGGFGVLPAGLYLGKLMKVDSDRTGPAGPYWAWQYETVEVGDQPAGRWLWDNVSLSEKSLGRLGKTFEAHGATTDTDTDDLLGGIVCLEVTVGTINKGDRAGERKNDVANVLPADAHPLYGEVAAAATSGGSDPDDF